MSENSESRQYNLEEARDEADVLRQKVESGGAVDYRDAEEKTEEGYFKILNNHLHDGQFSEFLENIPESQRNQLALRIAEEAGGQIVGNVVANLDKFPGLDHKKIALKIIGQGGNQDGWVYRYIDKFHGLDQEVALKWIEMGGSPSVVAHIDKFSGLDHKKIALKMIEEDKDGVVADNLRIFKGLDKEVALALIEAGHGRKVVSNIDRFHSIDRKEIAEAIATFNEDMAKLRD